MGKLNRTKSILISFVGSNDAGKLINHKRDGAIITALQNDNYEKIVVSMDKIQFDNYKGVNHYNLRAFLSSTKL